MSRLNLILPRYTIVNTIMRILSIDPGKRNCGVCVYDTDTRTLVHVVLCSVFKSAYNYKQLLEWIRSMYVLVGTYQISKVLVEQQMSVNTTTVRIQAMLCGYMEAMNIPCITISPKWVKTQHQVLNKSYIQRKAWSVEWVRIRFSTDQIWLQCMNTYTKYDDICDAIVNAVTWSGHTHVDTVTITDDDTREACAIKECTREACAIGDCAN